MSNSVDRRSRNPYHRVWQKIRYGRRYSELYELARDIKSLRPLLKTLEQAGRDYEVDPIETKRAMTVAMSLLGAAATSSKKLREIAAALDAEISKDPFQVNILRAYQDCTVTPEQPPTFPDLRRAFVNRFSRDWREGSDSDYGGKTDYSVRKTLTVLGLPLANAKRGRPAGVRSQIGNPNR